MELIFFSMTQWAEHAETLWTKKHILYDKQKQTKKKIFQELCNSYDFYHLAHSPGTL